MSRGVKKIDLPKFEDRRGNLSFIEGGRHIPFDIRRAYWIYDVPGGQYRGGMLIARNRNLLSLCREVLSWSCVMREEGQNAIF